MAKSMCLAAKGRLQGRAAKLLPTRRKSRCNADWGMFALQLTCLYDQQSCIVYFKNVGYVYVYFWMLLPSEIFYDYKTFIQSLRPVSHIFSKCPDKVNEHHEPNIL